MYIMDTFLLEFSKDKPNLSLGNKEGFTGYIDFIKSSDMNESIMKGMDMHGRIFIAFKLKVKKIDDNGDNNEWSEIVGTLFERYSDSKGNMAYGTCYLLGEGNYHLWNDSRVRMNEMDDLFKRLKLLIHGNIIKSIKLSFDDNTDNVNGNGDYYIKLA